MSLLSSIGTGLDGWSASPTGTGCRRQESFSRSLAANPLRQQPFLAPRYRPPGMVCALIDRSIRIDIPEEQRASSARLPAHTDRRKIGFAAVEIVIERQQERQYALLPGGISHLVIGGAGFDDGVEMRSELFSHSIVEHVNAFEPLEG